MKRLIFLLICMSMLAACALAEPTQTGEPTTTPSPTATLAPTPTPTAIPVGELFSCDVLSINLPYGLTLLDEAALAGYKAAVQADFEGAARTLAVAADGNGGVEVVSEGGKSYLAVDVDTTAKTVTIVL